MLILFLLVVLFRISTVDLFNELFLTPLFPFDDNDPLWPVV